MDSFISNAVLGGDWGHISHICMPPRFLLCCNTSNKFLNLTDLIPSFLPQLIKVFKSSTLYMKNRNESCCQSPSRNASLDGFYLIEDSTRRFIKDQ